MFAQENNYIQLKKGYKKILQEVLILICHLL